MDEHQQQSSPPRQQLSISGWLQKKKGGLFGGYVRSWWVLDFPTQSFSEYRSPVAANAGPISEIDPHEIKKVVKKGKESFCVMVKDKEIILKAEDETLRNRWLDVFGEFLLALPTDRNARVEDQIVLPKSNVTLTKGASVRTLAGNNAGTPPSPANATSPGPRTSTASISEPDRRPVSMSINDEARNRASTSKRLVPEAPDKKNAAIMETGVFMGKARNFAVSTNKDFAESAKRKGGLNTGQPKRDLEGAEEGGESSKKRAAVIPVMTPEEQIEEARYQKTNEQNDKLLKVVEDQLANFFGGNLLKEVEAQAIVDLMFQVKVSKNTNVITQGEATDRMFVIEKGSVGIYTQDFVDRPPELEHVKTVGDIFGVLSLLYNQPGPFTVKAHSECILWAVTRRKFHELTTNETKRRVARKIRLLEGVPLIYDNLEQSIIVQLADSMEFKEYESGAIVVKAGEELKRVYIVGDGTAKLQIGDKTTGELQKGDAFGEWALLDIGSKSDANLVATSTLGILTLEVKEVEELVGPLRAFVLRKWAETRGEQFFFSNATRGGTVFKPDSDVRNPLSRMKQTVQFGTGNVPTEDLSPRDTGEIPITNATTAGTDGGVATTAEEIVAAMNKEQQDQAIAEALQAAKSRGTKADRKTAAGRKTAGRKTAALNKKASKEAIVEPPKKEETSSVPPPPANAAAVEVEEEEIIPPPDDSEADEGEEDSEAGGEEENLDKPFDPAPPIRPDLIMSSIKLCALLGRGNFGRVHLARNESNHKELFALKVLGRAFIVQNGWETLVENERNAMLELSGLTRSPFLLSMYNSFSDSKNIYLLLELCEGGDLYNLLRITKNNRFNEEVSKFYMACVVMGLEAMQSRELVYRDLKPENLMLSRSGYIKVADFGLAKKTLRTFTVCGTPDYMAPEVILSRGHGMPVDWWAIGVLLFEMLTAITPFFGNEAMDIYENVLAHETMDDLQFPDDIAMSTEAKDLIRHLVHPKKNKRLGICYPGVKGVKNHPFFKKFDWGTLATQKMVPPLMPQIVDMSKYTTGNVSYDAKLNNAPDDNSGWTLSF